MTRRLALPVFLAASAALGSFNCLLLTEQGVGRRALPEGDVTALPAAAVPRPLECSLLLRHGGVNEAADDTLPRSDHRYETSREEYWRTYIVQQDDALDGELSDAIVAGVVLDSFSLDSMLWINWSVPVFSADTEYHRRVCQEQLGSGLRIYPVNLSESATGLDAFAANQGWSDASSQNRTQHRIQLLQMGSTDDPSQILTGATQLLEGGLIKHVIWRISARDARSTESSQNALEQLFKAGYEVVEHDGAGGGRLRDVPWLHDSVRVQQLLRSATLQETKEVSVWFHYPTDRRGSPSHSLTLVPSSWHPPHEAIAIPPLDCPKFVADAKAGRRAFPDPNEGVDPAKTQVLVSRDENRSFWMSLHIPRVDPDNWSIITQGRHSNAQLEQMMTAILQSSPSDSRVLDVGSHVGYYSLLASSLGASVDAFEPNDASNLRLCESIALNHDNGTRDDRIRVHALGVSDRDALEHYLPAVYLPERSKYAVPGSDAYEDREFLPRRPVVALDRFAHRQGWLRGAGGGGVMVPPVTILKISAPGMEDRVVSGSRYLLTRKLVDNVLLVLSANHPQELAAGRSAVLLLVQFGYRVAGYGGVDGSVRPLQRVPPASSRDDAEAVASWVVEMAEWERHHRLTVWFQPSKH